jgi:hypothetical protein
MTNEEFSKLVRNLYIIFIYIIIYFDKEMEMIREQTKGVGFNVWIQVLPVFTQEYVIIA